MRTLLLGASLCLAGCGMQTEETDYKLAGVGLNPDDIGPTPEKYSGLISYDWIEFSGAALPLGLVGLVSFTSSGPALGDASPPYAMVLGSALVMDSDLPETDALFGSFGVPPKKVGSCHTVYEPAAYVSGLADVGTYVDLSTADKSQGFTLGRRPLNYPPDVRDVFPTYLDLEVWRQTPRAYTPRGADLSTSGEVVIDRPNFPFGQEVVLDFPGAIPPETAPFSSIPVPAAAGGADLTHPMPTRPSGVMLSWTGPLYSGDGENLGEGETTTCLQFHPHASPPTSPADCANYEFPEEPAGGLYPHGQMYTAPWETESGVTFSWTPATEEVEETVSISIRLLGPVDEADDSFVSAVVPFSTSEIDDISDAWDDAMGDSIPEGAELPATAYRPAQSCDEPEDIEWLFDPTLRQGSDYTPSLQGSPFRTMVEVTCNVDDTSGTFTIDDAVLADALAYAQVHGAKGAIFTFNRSTRTPMTIPAVRDYVGNKRNTSDILVVSNAAQIGRFWVEPGSLE